jgi:hypothetical protein
MKDATDSAERRALKEKYPVEAQSYGGFESAEKYLRDQRKLRKKVEENDRLSGEQRQRRLDAIEKRIQDIQHRALTNYGHKLQQALH